MVKKMSEEDKEYFDKTYEYVRHNIFNHGKDHSLSPSIVTGIRGMTTGRAHDNKNQEAKADYPFKVIYLAFLMSRPKIDYAMEHKNFKNEEVAFAYISKIVQSNIGYVYDRLKNNTIRNNLMDNVEITMHDRKYERKTKDVHNDKMNGLW